MGLVERRAVKEFQDRRLPALQQQVAEAAGFEVPLEIAWDQLARDDQARYFDEGWTKVYFDPLVAALQAITVDDMGRDALKAGLTKVVIKSEGGIYDGERMASFAGGVLTLDHEPFTNVDDVAERSAAIQRALEKGL